MNIFLILLLSLGLILLLKTKSRVKRVYIYNKINESDKHQDKKEVNNQDKTLSNYISIPFLLEEVIYFKIIIIVALLTVILILLSIDIITISFRSSLIIGLTILITTLYLPKIVIKNVITRRTDSVLKSLPFFIDITAACVQSGMTIDNSLSYTAKKFTLINSDLSRMILKITKHAEINGLESAIKEFHQCSSATEIRMFCSALQYSISFGSSVYEQLIKLSQDIREMQLLVTEEKISKLSAKLTFPLFLFILIPFIVLVISPSILEILTYV
ncbi:type II secretion system F family protein [Yersinia rochesterensis]|uniref:type II secretion system F family protein n=1 Tax=Yersinia TaxID=629 RepID=UPI00224090E3|nr:MULTISPECIES: type II secretion system F family protein [Yersinia]MDA5544047.1 type II secretion system F family protein [Yersinia rochesterensis]UZM74597.1 type II secretion system F family protein [Yersinia sp. SCPM-O-B-9106 (C-191)]